MSVQKAGLPLFVEQTLKPVTMARTKQQHAVMQKKHGQPYHVILMDSAEDAIQGAVDENRYMPKEWYNIMTAHPVQWDAEKNDWIQINTD